VKDEEFSTQWLYNEADTQWANWLPEEVSKTIRHGGYYTTLIKPGLRIISMNMNYCYVINWWILYQSQDPASGLLWLSEVLQEAESNNEKVHRHLCRGD
jgi:sphingomyelin phosphodiesterase